MSPILLALILVVLIVVVWFFIRANSQAGPPKNNPKAFLESEQPVPAVNVIVCAGDSITHGNVSANYVDMLEGRFQSDDYVFINAGINGNLAWNVAQRLDEIIACNPDIVTLLIGTNDVNATMSEQSTQRYIRGQGLPQSPDLAWYRKNVTRIIDRLQEDTHAQIAVLTLPPLGEDLNSEMNQRIVTYNDALKTIAQAKQVTLLDLHEKLCALLPENHTPPPYEGNLMLIFTAAFQYYFLRRSWDDISKAHDLVLLTDHIHLNDTAATVVADLLTDFIKNNV